MLHNTTCNLGFNEQANIKDIIHDAQYLISYCKSAMENSRQPEGLAKDLCSILDRLNEMKRHNEVIYPIFDRADTLSSQVRKLS